MKKLIINKGYTLEVKSWENDGDSKNIKKKTVPSYEEAKALNAMMELCRSKNNQPKGVIRLGNTIDGFSLAQQELIYNFLKENPILLGSNIIEGDDENADETEVYEAYTDFFRDLAGQLLGYSEYYDCRVMESCTVTFSAEDVYLEEIKF